MSAHTPGPWKDRRSTSDPETILIFASGARIVGRISADKGSELVPEGLRINADETTENARLIAAAPDLLEALKLALAALDCEVDNAPISPVVARSAQAWMRGKFGDAARAAIAKTEGAYE
jgi:hypothetical protein